MLGKGFLLGFITVAELRTHPLRITAPEFWFQGFAVIKEPADVSPPRPKVRFPRSAQ